MTNTHKRLTILELELLETRHAVEDLKALVRQLVEATGANIDVDVMREMSPRKDLADRLDAQIKVQSENNSQE